MFMMVNKKNSETKQPKKKKKKKKRNLRGTSKGRKELQSRRTVWRSPALSPFKKSFDRALVIEQAFSPEPQKSAGFFPTKQPTSNNQEPYSLCPK